jgi:3-oxoacid CoA-transferase subunit A
MATAARATVVEVETMVESGTFDADHIITPGIFVDRIVPLAQVAKRIEQRTVRKRELA